MSQADYGSLRAVRLRVAKLDPTTFAPLVGSTNGYVSNAQIQVTVGINVTTGDTGEQKNGNGDICQTFTDPDRLKSVALGIELCSADPILLSFLTGGTLFTDPGHSSLPVGLQAPSASGTLNAPVSVECWTKAWDGSSQVVATSTSPNAAYWHWVFPHCNFVEDTITLNNGVHTFPVKGTSVDNLNLTANGPFNDWPTYMAQNGGVTTAYGRFLDGTTLPTVTDARIAVPSGS